MPTDAETLQQLRDAGSDLSKLHRVVYQLRFANEDEAERARARLEDLAFQVTVQRADANGEFVLQAAKRMYPVQSDLEQLSTKVRSVAADDNGIYEGWRATQLP